MSSKSNRSANTIQIALLVNSLSQPKWEENKGKEIARLNGAWNKKWENNEKQKTLNKIDEYEVDLLLSIKNQIQTQIDFAKMKDKKFHNIVGINLLAMGTIGTIGRADLLNNPTIFDEAFIQDIQGISKGERFFEEAAYALLGLELAHKDGRYLPTILEVFEKTQSTRLARQLGKVSWDKRVLDTLTQATKAPFIKYIPEGLSRKPVDGLGLSASLALLDLKDEEGHSVMVTNLLHIHTLDYESRITQFLIYTGDITVPHLIRGLEFDDNKALGKAIYCLGEIGDKAATQPLINVLNEDDELILVKTVEALSKLKDEKAIEPLRLLMTSENKKVSRAAKKAIKKIKK